MAKVTSSCYMVFIALGIIPTCLWQAHLCCAVSLLRCRAVLCLSCSRAVSERSDSLCCWRASLLLSLSYCRFSSLKRLLHLWTRVLWPGVVVSPRSIVSSKTGTCRRVRTLYVNSYTSVVNPLRTYIHTYIHTSTTSD